MKPLGICLLVGAALSLAVLSLRPLRIPVSVQPEAQTVSSRPRADAASNPTTLQASRESNGATPSAANKPVAQSATAAPETYEPAVAAFSNWAQQFLSGRTNLSVAQGEALAWKRREALIELIQTNPERALALAAPFAWRSALPASITRHFEQRIDGRGSLNVAIATDFEQGRVSVLRDAQVGGKSFQTFVYGRRLTQPTQEQIPLHGISLDGKLALSTEPLRVLEPGEAEVLAKQRGEVVEKICGVSGQPAGARNQPVAAEVGGEVRFFCGMDHAKLVNDQWALAESGRDSFGAKLATASNDAWTRGPKTLLYMRVNFPDDLTEPISEAGAYNVMDGVNDFYTEGSYDLTALDSTVTPLFTLPQPKSYYTTAGPGALLSDARDISRKGGYETANYDRDIVAFTSVPGFAFGGLAYVHGKGVWLQSMGVGVTAHELGHNWGLWHANYWDVGTNNSVIGPGLNEEYGNVFDTMGNAIAGNNQFNATHKNVLDWLPDTAVYNVVTNGIYQIYPFDVPNRIDGHFYAAKIRKDFQRTYWLEFRDRFKSNPWFQYGVLLDWAPWADSNGGTSLLDTTPGTPTPNNSKQDAAVVVGRTFTDPSAGLHLTTLARGMDGTNAWLKFQINQGQFPYNRAPSLQMEIESTSAAPNTLVHFHATATDPDGDTLAYAWSYDDFTFSTNNLPWAVRSWSTPGEHVVRCVVSDMKGGVASANGVVTVGAPAGFRVTGRVIALNGLPLEGVRVDNGVANLSGYLGGYTDSDGRYIITGVTADLNLNANLYGFVITNASTWVNPLTLISNTANIDFVAVPMTTVHLAASTNAVAENDISSTNLLTLTRAGDTNADLTVSLYLSGSATLDTDYKLTPTLTNGLSTVIIPAGSNTITFAFKTINDSLVEGPETATITILEDPSYVVAPMAEATITIIDDDLPGQSVVSVTAVTPTIAENGTDHAQLLFTRTGSVQNDLPVSYSVGGTATAGVDYTTLLGVVVIPAGQYSTTLEFRPIDDKNVEPNETVIVTLNASPAYNLGLSPATMTILDDDVLTVSIATTSDTAAEPTIPGRFTVKRDGDLSAGLVVGYTVAGTAIPDANYVPLSGSVTIPAGATTADISVMPIDDNQLTGDTSVIVTLTNSPGYDVGTPGSATLFIRDRQKVAVSITATDDTASEPGSDTGMFTISRGTVVNGPLTVKLAISGSALNGIDYVPLDNTVVIPDGASSVNLEVIPFDDLQVEYTESVILTLLPSSTYDIATPSQATVSILDDDVNSVPAVGFCFATSAVPESLSPGVCVALSATSGVPISVDYKVLGGTASTNDYTLPPGTLNFLPGEFAKALPLAIRNNTIAEPNRTIRLVLFNPLNATLDGIKIHTYTILDDDTNTVSIAATIPTASETGPTPGNFRITRAGPTANSLLVNFQVTGTASAPSDYAPLGNSVTIPAGAGFVDLPIVPTNDRTVELNQTVVVTLTSVPGSTIQAPSSAIVTIVDNDTNALPVITVSSTNHPYAVEGGANGEFVFTRSATNGPFTISFSISGTANSGVDYVALPTSLSFADGQASLSLPVVAIDDALVEGEETVVVALNLDSTFRAAHPSSATVIIQDNDQNVRLDASDFTAAEPGTDTGEFTFTRFGTTNTDVRVFYSISGTASNGIDYVAISNSITIPAGSLTAKLSIVPLDDTLVEGPETVTLTLLPNAAYSFGASTIGTVIINDDEPMLTLVATVPGVVEGSQHPGVFTLYRTGDPKYDFTAHLAVGGTATYGVDYPPFPTNVYFSCGVTSIDLLVFPTNELVIEGTEMVTALILPDPTYTILSPSNALITIEDAATNHAPVVTITSPTATPIFLLGTNVNIILEASVTDDGDTNTPPVLLWTQVSGPSTMAFGSTNTTASTAGFTNVGVYVLRLTADDGQLQTYADLTVVVGAVDLLSTNLLHWTFDDARGTNAVDSSGAGRDGVLVGAPAWDANGVLAGALRFHGANEYVQETGGATWLDGRDAFSLSLWIKSATANTDQGILTAADSGTNATLSMATRTFASCGHSTNVLEVTVPTTDGYARHISASGSLTNGWQHLVLSWSNGLAPVLYINGQKDQPLNQMVQLGGVLTNCPQFIVGKGPPGIPNSWNGWIDDVRVFPRALTAEEVGALAALPPTNFGPVVDAGPDVTIQLITPVVLGGFVSDDGQPVPPGAVSNNWSLVNGPTTVTITNANNLTNSIQFSQAGTYVFRLLSDDGQVRVFDDITVTVIEPTRVDISATDSEAAELGPDTGTFTFMRNGDLTVDLTVFLAMSGTASNGMDFVQLTNVINFPVGTDTVAMVVTPYLDNRTEGDETLTFTIVSNLSYSIGSGSATVTIHDSPYGMWNIAHFTLEELTDPNLSGEAADFDHDGLVNFAEYAVNIDPKSPETNAPLATALELNPADGQNHITLTYHRRVQPTDVGYAPYVSNDLLLWNTGTNYVEELQATPDVNGITETVKSRIVAPYTTATNQFVTVRVWLLVTRP